MVAFHVRKGRISNAWSLEMLIQIMIEGGTFHQPHRGGGRGLRDVLQQQVLPLGEQEDHVGAGRAGGGGGPGD